MAASGTFTGTGSSATLKTSKPFSLSLTFAGAATVKLQRCLDGANWRDVASYTASTETVITPAGDTEFRLTCSAYTNDVAYWAGN